MTGPLELIIDRPEIADYIHAGRDRESVMLSITNPLQKWPVEYPLDADQARTLGAELIRLASEIDGKTP